MKKVLYFIVIALVFVGISGMEYWIAPDVAESSGEKGRKTVEQQVTPASQKVKQEDALEKAFAASKARFVSRNINGWARIDGKKHTLDELRDIAKEAGRFFKLKGNGPVESTEIEGVRQALIQGIDHDKQVINIIVNNNKEREGFATYLIVDITNSSSIGNAAGVDAKIRSYYKKFGLKPTVTQCIQGALDRALDNKEITAVQASVFKAVKASKVEGLTQDGFISISGHTPRISDKVSSSNGDINLQVALRKDSSGKRTLVWIGTPVITLEY